MPSLKIEQSGWQQDAKSKEFSYREMISEFI